LKSKPFLLFSLTLAFVSDPTWAQPERNLVIGPGLAGSHDLITISVTNSKCFTLSDVHRSFNDVFQVTLTYLFEPSERCLEENPDAPDFKTTVGPLPPGTYQVGLFINYGGRGSDLADSRSFAVIETPRPAADLSDGGINGLYHDVQAPHRYFYVLETDYTTLVVWNTFDSKGKQRWIYGVGDLLNNGSSVVAEAFINTSGGFLPNGEADDDVEPWGLIRLDLQSCTEGTVTFRRNVPGAGLGRFSVVRLAYSKQIGCVHSE